MTVQDTPDGCDLSPRRSRLSADDHIIGKTLHLCESSARVSEGDFSTTCDICPDLACPLQEALVAVAAVHQLVSAVHTFSHCLRPLLLSKTAVLSSSAGPGGLDIQASRCSSPYFTIATCSGCIVEWAGVG